jgi:tetratricopeptide (TPR) repeat protein
MRVRSTVVFLVFAVSLSASEALDRAHRFEEAGDSAAAREAFTSAIRMTPNDAELLEGYAELLERYHDPAARALYRRTAEVWKKDGKPPNALAAWRRAVLLDLIAGDNKSAASDLAEYRSSGGTGLQLPQAPPMPMEPAQTIEIPGPLRSFARMIAISADTAPEEVLPAIARNVVTNGYQASRSADELEETEFLKLAHRYLSQARELDKLAGADKVIRVPACESTQTNDLLRVLGFRMRGGCGSEVVLETVNAPRAFLTTDSGFPLAELEQSLRTDKPFSYDFHPTRVPVLYSADYWINAKEKAQGDFIDAFLGDPGLCRFYLGMAKLDPETAEALKKASTPLRLRAFASVLDFFGGNFEIREGKAVVPGGGKSAAAWGELAGASPNNGPEFFEKLMTRDDGWLASLYDALARIQGPVEDYLTEPARMKRFYAAIRGKVTTPGPARPVFRSNADMMLLTTRLHIDADGSPHIPGGLEIWRMMFARNVRGKYDARLSRAASSWREPDDVLEALFALCRKPVDNDALKMFMALTDIDRGRPLPLAPATVDRLMKNWSVYSAQYSIFADAPTVSDKTVVQWLDAAENVDKIRDPEFRQDAIGTMQGLSGIWQIFCRQGSIPAGKADETLAGLTAPFATLKNDRDLFDAGRHGLTLLPNAAPSAAAAGNLQDRLLALLAGGANVDQSDSRGTLVKEEQRIFESQKLLPADLIFELADNLEGVSKGEKLNAQLASRMAARVADIQLPRNSMSGAEKNTVAFGYYVDKHIDDERKLNFRAMIDKASKDPERLKDIRGLLAPTLRDTIVGYNYIFYAPPGAQILMTNPLFVRGHDFIGMQGANHSWHVTEPYGSGWPSNAGGRLVGSLAGLPYALAESEQNFLVPTQTQALIWGDLVPQMMLAAKTPRFWGVSPVQMHWVGLNMRFAETEVAEAAVNPAERDAVVNAINAAASPWRASLVRNALTQGDVRGALDLLTPSEMYAMARSLYGKTGAAAQESPAAKEIAHYKTLSAELVSPSEISRAWGTPKPTLANSYRSELLNLRTFPTLMGYSSRIMAESWESNLLYWAEVGDEIGARPAQLNVLVPEWTEKVVERIFASHLEDWPALLKSLRSVGDEVRSQSAQAASIEKTALE